MNFPTKNLLIEFLTSGYISGGETLLGDHVLQAGEILSNNEPTRIWRFYPNQLNIQNEDTLLEQLSEATYKSFTNQKLSGPVLVPLSGGLDSRLVLAYLHKLGVPDLRAWSYGPAGNHDAKIAGEVAKRLGIPWEFCQSTRASARKLWNSSLRKAYWNYQNNYQSVPNMQEFQPLLDYRPPSNVTIVNGQSGDWVTGGHIPGSINSFNEFYQAVINRHYSLWPYLKPQISEIMLSKVRAIINNVCLDNWYGWPYVWDAYEWVTRQSIYVCGQTKIYDFLGHKWSMPLWDQCYLDFWKNVPALYRMNQRLYKKWLKRWNYKGVFDIPVRTSIWPGLWRYATIPLANLYRPRKTEAYDILKYLIGIHSHQYAQYEFKHYLKRIGKIRNIVSLYAETFLVEQFTDELVVEMCSGKEAS